MEKEPGRTERPTLKQIAKQIGVSVTAVSNVLNDHPHANAYSKETRQRIRDVAREVGYVPNPLAQSLKRRKTNLVGAIVFSQQSPHYASMLRAAREAVRAHGLDVVTADMARDLERFPECVQQLTAWRVEGVLAIVGGHPLEQGLLMTLWDAGTPVTVIGASRPEFPFPNIHEDNYGAGRMAAEHLVKLGHRHFGVLAANPRNEHSHDRVRGVQTVLREHGIELDADQVALSEDTRWEISTGYANAARILERHPETTAIIGLNDAMAIGAKRRLHELGRRIPADVSLIGFDDVFFGDSTEPENRLGIYTTPALTTLRMPVDRMGAAAGELLAAMLRDGKAAHANASMDFDAELIVRESTGAAPEVG